MSATNLSTAHFGWKSWSGPCKQLGSPGELGSLRSYSVQDIWITQMIDQQTCPLGLLDHHSWMGKKVLLRPGSVNTRMVICHIEHSVLLLVCLHEIQVCSYPSHQSLLISHFWGSRPPWWDHRSLQSSSSGARPRDCPGGLIAPCLGSYWLLGTEYTPYYLQLSKVGTLGAGPTSFVGKANVQPSPCNVP